MKTQEWQQARLSRDPRFDGLFYIGVLTTGIFCRPICPARLPREDNVRYLRSPAEAIEQGFRPCRRCRPEYSPSAAQRYPDERLDAALCAIDHGFLDQHNAPALAASVGLSDRQLRRLFEDSLGISPQQLAGTRRLLLAKQLLCESNLSITDIALAAGFNSVRRFNSKMKAFYQQTPSQIRQHKRLATCAAAADALVMELPHAEHYPWRQVFSFYQQRAVPGLESADDVSLQRWLRLGDAIIGLRCEKLRRRPVIRLTLEGASADQLHSLIALVRKALDLNSNHLAIASHLQQEPHLQPLIHTQGPVALPGAWDPFEYLVRAIIGQQVSVKAAKTLTQRLLTRLGSPAPTLSVTPSGSEPLMLFPSAATIAGANLDGLGMPRSRIATLQAVARAQAESELITAAQAQPCLSTLQQRLLAIKGIGPWTVNYLMMRGFYQPDIWLETDLGVINALQQLDPSLSRAAVRELSQQWAPWRSYAVMALWRSLA